MIAGQRPYFHVGDSQEVFSVLGNGDVVKDILHSQGHNARLAGCAPHGMGLATARLPIGEYGAIEATDYFGDEVLGRVLIDGLCAPSTVKDVVQCVHSFRQVPARRLNRITVYFPC